jgi:hypothetical protein
MSKVPYKGPQGTIPIFKTLYAKFPTCIVIYSHPIIFQGNFNALRLAQAFDIFLRRNVLLEFSQSTKGTWSRRQGFNFRQ